MSSILVAGWMDKATRLSCTSLSPLKVRHHVVAVTSHDLYCYLSVAVDVVLVLDHERLYLDLQRDLPSSTDIVPLPKSGGVSRGHWVGSPAWDDSCGSIC